MKKYIFPAAVAFCALSAAFMSVSCVSSEAESEPYACRGCMMLRFCDLTMTRQNLRLS